jgi:peptide/nickel transport system substrate-binding protein
LSFAPQIVVPPDAWVDWNATSQTFISAAEKYPEGVTAQVKSVVTYPANLFTTVKWHDGSPLDVGDFIAAMIVQYDRGKPESAIYDSSASWYYDYLVNSIKGIKIVSTDPLVIETYSNLVNHDAELNVYPWWPKGTTGPMPWHTLTLGIMAEKDGLLAFSADKASEASVEQTNFIDGPSLPLLSAKLMQAQSGSYIPYAPTLGAFITPAEAAARYVNLSSWFQLHGHFWVGDGPFYLDEAYPLEKSATLERFALFPDPAGKWDAFSESMLDRLLYIPIVRR